MVVNEDGNKNRIKNLRNGKFILIKHKYSNPETGVAYSLEVHIDNRKEFILVQVFQILSYLGMFLMFRILTFLFQKSIGSLFVDPIIKKMTGIDKKNVGLLRRIEIVTVYEFLNTDLYNKEDRIHERIRVIFNKSFNLMRVLVGLHQFEELKGR